jgi:hypothetical protein
MEFLSKNIPVYSVLFFLLMTAFGPAKVQNTGELILQLPEAGPKNIHQIITALSNLNGVTYSGYCENEKCFFLLVDRDINPDNTAVTEKIKSLGMSFSEKTGATIANAIGHCSNFIEPAPLSETNPN